MTDTPRALDGELEKLVVRMRRWADSELADAPGLSSADFKACAIAYVRQCADELKTLSVLSRERRRQQEEKTTKDAARNRPESDVPAVELHAKSANGCAPSLEKQIAFLRAVVLAYRKEGILRGWTPDLRADTEMWCAILESLQATERPSLRSDCVDDGSSAPQATGNADESSSSSVSILRSALEEIAQTGKPHTWRTDRRCVSCFAQRALDEVEK